METHLPKLVLETDKHARIIKLALDSEDGRHLGDNLLAAPSCLLNGETVAGEDVLQLRCDGDETHKNIIIKNVCADTLSEITLILKFDSLFTATVLYPTALGDKGAYLPPWMLLAPDCGYSLIVPQPTDGWKATVRGRRGHAPANAPRAGVSPLLRGDIWIQAAGIKNYRRGEIEICFTYSGQLTPENQVELRLTVPELLRPKGLDEETWMQIRRPYMNVWQPASNWAGEKAARVLANNVLSDPCACSLWYYSGPMHFWHELLPGIDMLLLLRHSLEFFLEHYCSPVGHMISFGMHDLYVSTNANFLIAAWDYYKITKDRTWFIPYLKKLNNLADYLIRRDIDGDGIIESYGSGNRGMLRDPDRADVWWEMVNFNFKNSWLNILAYRAFLCFAEILESCGHDLGAERYRQAARKIKQVFFSMFYNPATGVLASWISMDGEKHDYAYVPIIGLAVAYGLVPLDQKPVLMRRMLALLDQTGFKTYHLGLPLNLIPIHPLDRIQPPIGLDSEEDERWRQYGGEDGSADYGIQVYNGSLSPVQTWHFLLALQIAGLDNEADRILGAMIETAHHGGFQNGIVNCGYGGAEHLRWDGNTCGYEGYLADEWAFLSAAFTRNRKMQKELLGPVYEE